MARRSTTEKISREIVTVTGICPTKTDIVAAQVGFAYGLKQIIATNNNGVIVGLNICEGNDAIMPTIVLPGSGTFLWDIPGGGGLELAVGSGITACLTSTGSVEFAAYFTPYDERAGITKEEARTATFISSNATAIRTPNQFGNQTQS